MLTRWSRLSGVAFGVFAGALVLGALLLPAMAFAAAGTGTIKGTVTDSVTGKPVSAVQVYTTREPDGGWYGASGSTDSNGEYAISGLPDGDYSVDFWSWNNYFEQYFNGKWSWQSAGRLHVVGGTIAIADAALMPIPKFGADAQEPDDSFKLAPLVKTDGTSTLHTIFPNGDVDFVKFPVRAGYVYTVEADTLYDGAHWVSPDVRVYDQNRNPIYNYASGRMTFVAQKDGYAYAQAKAWNGTGFYGLSVTGALPAAIAGKVTAEDTHNPLKNVDVELVQFTGSAWGSWGDWVGLKATDANGEYEFADLATDSTYRVVFETLRQPDYVGEWYDNVSAGLSEYDATPVLVKPGQTTTANAELTRAGAIEGTVTDEKTGKPIPNIVVSAYDTAGDSMSGYQHMGWVTTDALGHYDFGSLGASSYKVHFSDEMSGYQDEWFADKQTAADADPVAVAVGGRAHADAKLAINANSAVVRGVVTDRADGTPIGDIRVRVEPVGQPSSSGYQTMSMGATFSGYSSGYWTTTASDGSYRLGGLNSAGGDVKWRISFSDPESGYQSQYFDGQETAGQATLVTLPRGEFFDANATLDLKPNTAKVTGTVTDKATGQPVTSAWVGWQSQSGYGMSGYGDGMSGYDMSGYSHGVSTDANGKYSIRGIPAGVAVALSARAHDLPQMYYDNKPSFQLADKLVFSSGESRQIGFALSDWGHIAGHVSEDGTGRDLGGISVEVYSNTTMSGASFDQGSQSGYQTQSGYFVGTARTDETGAYQLDHLSPYAKYKVFFSDPGPEGHQSEWYADKPTFEAADEITVPGGGITTVDASLAHDAVFGDIVGKAVEASTGKPIGSIQVDVFTGVINPGGSVTLGELVDRQHTLADGTYRFGALLPGEPYFVKFSDPLGRVNSQWFNGLASTSDRPTAITLVDGQTAIANASLCTIDTTPPTVSDNIVGTYFGSASITLSATDTISGVKSITSSLDSAAPQVVAGNSATVTVKAAGFHTLAYFAEDVAGNTSVLVAKSFTVVHYGGLKGVVSSGGSPISGAAITASGLATATSGVNGSYLVGSAIPSTYTVQVAKSGYETKTASVVISPDTTTTQNFSLVALPGALSGHVTSAGAPVLGVSVKVGAMPSVLTTVGGVYRVPNITPGTYSVQFAKSGFATQTVTGVVVGPGANVTRDASLTPLTYTVGATAGPGGTISATQTVTWGANATITVSASAGYHIVNVLVDGVSKGAISAYVFTNVTANHTISATFAANPVVKTTVTIDRSPSAATLTYNRKRHGVRFTLSATFTDSTKSLLKGATVYLQSSSNGKNWNNYATLTTGSNGTASRSFHVRHASTVYYRWYSPATTLHFEAYTTAQKVIVK